MAEDSASWYQRKLAQARGAAPPFQQARPPVSPYQQGYQQQTPHQNQAPAAARQSPEVQQPVGTPETLTEFLDLQGRGQIKTQGKAAKLNPDPCPNCGGNLFYADLGLKRRGPAPAPHCFTCGYNEMFEQGLESNWQGGA